MRPMGEACWCRRSRSTENRSRFLAFSLPRLAGAGLSTVVKNHVVFTSSQLTSSAVVVDRRLHHGPVSLGMIVETHLDITEIPAGFISVGRPL